MQKKSVLIPLLIVLFASFALAQNASNGSIAPPIISSQTNADVISKAYQCLQTQVNDKEENALSLQEAVFGLLALGSNQKLVNVVESKKTQNFWSESSNSLKDTSQVLLAYNRIGRDTAAIKDWILAKEKAADDLSWFIEIDIDSHESSDCTLSYSNENQRTVTINEDMTLSGNPGSCLSIAAGGYWLRVANTCINQSFTISCDKDFTTSTLYQRTGSSTVFVSPVAQSTAALGTTVETINSKCLSSSSTACDYEGTLWAALALDKTGSSITQYLPYLLALSESNKRYLPSSFLHLLTDGQDQYSELVQLQQNNQFWQAPTTPYNRYYDSALAIMSLQATSSAELQSSKSYFEGITTPEGCWNNNNIRDTAFLLYAGWTRAVSSSGGSGTTADTCESRGYTCSSSLTCGNLGGEALENYLCPGTLVCCSKSPEVLSCAEQNGKVCLSSESCSGTSTSSTDGSCCLGVCAPAAQQDACALAGGKCYGSCLETEEQISATCSSGGVCCAPKTSSSEESNLGIWITILVILIILVVAGILMRNKIKMLLFKARRSSSSQPPKSGVPRPPFPPSRGPIPYPRAQPRVVMPSSPAARRPLSSKDKEMEETMRKLREMSK